jgi:DNA-binding IclR family transcriptional regulator
MAKTKKAPAAPKVPTPKSSKTDKVIELLRRPGGASITEIVEATAWLPHTTRAMLTGLRKKGFAIDKAKLEGTTRYSISQEPAA